MLLKSIEEMLWAFLVFDWGIKEKKDRFWDQIERIQNEKHFFSRKEILIENDKGLFLFKTIITCYFFNNSDYF